MNNKVKPSYDEKRQCLGEVLPLSTPFTVVIDASEACNFKCNYCFRSQGDKFVWGYADNTLMEWDVFTKAIFQIMQFPEEVKHISLSHHGEPLCNKNIPEMVKYIKEQGIKAKVSIHTNASLLNREYAERLAESKIDKVVVSLQGLDSEKYKDVCGYTLNYDELYQTLKIFYNIKKQTEVCIKITDAAVNEREEAEFINQYSEIADKVYVEKVMPIWEDVDIPTQTKKGTSVSNKYGMVFEKQLCCPLIFHTIVITPNGDIYPCTQLLSKEILGNINTDNLVDIWNGKRRQDLLKRQLKLKTDEICSKCYIKQNSIFTKEDMIDNFRNEILSRMQGEK